MKFKQRHALAASLALALLAGCAQPPSMPKGTTPANAPGNGASLVSGTPSASATAALGTVSLASNVESDLEAYDLLSDTLSMPSAHYVVFATQAPQGAAAGKAAAKAAIQPATVGASKGRAPKFDFGAFKGKLSADQASKLADHRAHRKAARQNDLKGRTDESAALSTADKAAVWQDNKNGTSSKTLNFNLNKALNGQAVTRQVTMVRTVTNDTHTVVSLNTDLIDTMADGSKQVIGQDRTLMANGTYRVVLKSEYTGKDGSKRVTSWDKTVDASGQVKGTGTVATADASGKSTSAVPFSVSGDEANPTVAPIVPNKPSANPSAKATAKAKLGKVLVLVARAGDAGLKVHNVLKKGQPVAKPGAYRLFGVDGTSTDDQIAADVTASAPVAADDGNAGDLEEGQTLTVGDDGGACETGTVALDETVDANKDVRSGQLNFTPDADAATKGVGAEDVQFSVPDAQGATGDQAKLKATIAADATDASAGEATCDLSEQAQSDGDVTTSGTLTLPDGSQLQVDVTIHDDGTRDLEAHGDGIGFKIVGMSEDGVGSGFIYDGDPDDEQASQIGMISLHNGADDDTIAFFEDDGTLDEAQPVTFAI